MKSEVGFCFKIFKEWYQENRQNAYLALKYPRASGALRRAPDPMPKRARFAHTMLLCTISNLGLSQSGPPLIKSWIPPPPVVSFIAYSLYIMSNKYITLVLGNFLKKVLENEKKVSEI